jgi:uncharacterized protein YecT (DUF1311 family)
MKFALYLGCALALGSLVHPAQAQWPPGSAGEAGETDRPIDQAVENELNSKFEALKSLLLTKHISKLYGIDESFATDEELFRAIQDQEKAWRTYIDAECELIGNLGLGGSPWRSVGAVECETDLMRSRIKTVDAVMDCINHISGDGWFYQAVQCTKSLSVLVILPAN